MIHASRPRCLLLFPTVASRAAPLSPCAFRLHTDIGNTKNTFMLDVAILHPFVARHTGFGCGDPGRKARRNRSHKRGGSQAPIASRAGLVCSTWQVLDTPTAIYIHGRLKTQRKTTRTAEDSIFRQMRRAVARPWRAGHNLAATLSRRMPGPRSAASALRHSCAGITHLCRAYSHTRCL